MTPRRALFLGLMSATNYSGGRYHGYMMVEAVAALGFDVTLWTSEVPVFRDSCSEYPGHESIRLHIDPGFRSRPAGPFDLVIVIPHMGRPMGLYPQALLVAHRDGARLCLLNFESPNWYNALAPEPRDPHLWRGWGRVAAHSDLILSSAEESTVHARDWYGQAPSSSLFRHCFPPTNSAAATGTGPVTRERRILSITRFSRGSAHKGGRELIDAIGPEMSDCTLAVLVGAGGMPTDLRAEVEAATARHRVHLELLGNLTETDKFRELKRAQVLLFLSRFEGFGLPPIEARLCGAQCITFDLPVLREVNGDEVLYAPVGDTKAVRELLGRVLAEAPEQDHTPTARAVETASFDGYVQRLGPLLNEVLALQPPPAASTASPRTVAGWKRRLGAATIIDVLRRLRPLLRR